MTMLYGYKWTKVNGEEFAERTHAGQVWIAKTEELTDEEWFAAVDRCEREVRQNTKIGDDSWPPSYEEFVAYARDSGNKAYKRFTFGLPEPETVRKDRKNRGRQACEKLLSIFDE